MDKLLAQKLPPDILFQVIRDLKNSNYLNDEEYARTWIQTRLTSKTYGPQRIKQELVHKGIPNEIIEKVSTDMYKNLDLLELAKKALGKKREKLNSDIKTKQRLYNYLWRKGFPEEVIREALSLED